MVLQAIQDLAAIFLNSSAKRLFFSSGFELSLLFLRLISIFIFFFRLKDKGYNGSRKSSLKLPVEMSLPSTPSLSRLLSAINEVSH